MNKLDFLEIGKMIPHGFCINWSPTLLAFSVISNALIFLAYFSIPVALLILARGRFEKQYRPIMLLFAAFILACGTTHLWHIVTYWLPLYWIQALLDATTAIASVWTVLILYPLIPKLLNLPSHEQLIAVNHRLEQEITERKRAEDELRRYKNHLEEVVELRTADLVLARDAAEAANHAKSVFLANMSHELRTPLNAILGFSQIMVRNELIPAQELERLRIINRSGQHLLMLINDVLEMSKIEAGRVQLEIIPFDLGNLIRDVIDMMEIRAQEKGLKLLVDQASTFPRYIKGDEARLRQVLVNLTGNAVKFTKQGGVCVRFSTTLPNHQSHLIIEIEDSGPGISPEDQLRLFKPFVQLGKQIGENVGTGLGLAICQQYIHLMGGTISVDSTLGKGSIFRIDLPAEATLAEEITLHEQPSCKEVVGLAPGQPVYRILIVEDQLENQLLLTQLMEIIGLPVMVAVNGKQGVELFQSWQPHLIWMDQRMPVMDGMDATRIIRQMPDGKDVRIIAVTASVFKEQREEMFAAGINDIVRKPYRTYEIYECLEQNLGVKFIYEDNQYQVESVMGEIEPLTAEMMATLPEQVRVELKQALETLEANAIKNALEAVARISQPIHAALKQRTDIFDYPTILKLL